MGGQRRLPHTLPPVTGGGRRRVLGAGSTGLPPLLLTASSCGMGLEICLGALMVGRPFRLGPLRSDILLRSSDMVATQLFSEGSAWEQDAFDDVSVGGRLFSLSRCSTHQALRYILDPGFRRCAEALFRTAKEGLEDVPSRSLCSVIRICLQFFFYWKKRGQLRLKARASFFSTPRNDWISLTPTDSPVSAAPPSLSIADASRNAKLSLPFARCKNGADIQRRDGISRIRRGRSSR